MTTKLQTNNQLLQELSALITRNAELEALEIEHRRLEESLKRQAHDLKERIKEINCLYGISKIVENQKTTLEEIYTGIIGLIPASWQYPEITCARLAINGKTYQTENYADTPWQQSADVSVYGNKAGILYVGYLEERPESYEGPFLREERFLINAIVERLGRTTERKQAETALAESEQKLKKQNILLQEKNIALREVMNQLITEKKNLEDRVITNVDLLLLPLLKKMRNKGSQLDKEYVNVLEDNLTTLTSSFGTELSKKMPKLTPRENEICNLIKSGLSSKEIAGLLHISYRSVETYRNYIRKKLGITNRKVNLTTYLASL